jgi:hypothetical protein
MSIAFSFRELAFLVANTMFRNEKSSIAWRDARSTELFVDAIRKIFAPTDFSAHAAEAFRVAHTIAQAVGADMMLFRATSGRGA